MNMRISLCSAAFSVLALFYAGGSAHANSCQQDLQLERPGVIKMPGAARAATLTSQEALNLISAGGTLTFRRVIEDFWRIKVNRSVAPRDLDIRYQITNGTERAGYAVAIERSNQKFPVRITPGPPRILCENSRHRIISGGFTAQARASGIGLSGLYELEINVDVLER